MLANLIAIALCFLLGGFCLWYRLRQYRRAADCPPDIAEQRHHGVLIKLRLHWTFALMGRARMSAWLRADDGSTLEYRVPTLQLYHSLKRDVPGVATICQDYLVAFLPDSPVDAPSNSPE